ncbi:MAG: SirB1 family protein [Ktedonobacteraceae bacterium]|jgi:regulator of sirC expression with transglutaminase-like and TPR domain
MTESFPNDTPQQRAFRAFEALVAGGDASIDLSLAALLIACTEYPDLNIAYYMAQLDALAQRVRSLLNMPAPTSADSPLPATENYLLNVVAAMNEVLFQQEHFHGNTEDYYNPANSFLNEVLEQHIGLPITLSLLFIEVGKRVGVQFDGIGLPFHFVVGCLLPEGRIYIDPFEAGRIYSAQECHERVSRMLKGGEKIYDQWFEPVSHRHLLARLLNNLKHIYINKEDYERALSICDRLVLLLPRSPLERRDRAVIHFQLKHYARALHDFSAYTELAPHAPDIDEIRRQIKMLRQIIALMN